MLYASEEPTALFQNQNSFVAKFWETFFTPKQTFKSCGMWRRVVGLVVSDVSEGLTPFIFKVKGHIPARLDSSATPLSDAQT